jgi:ubiquinone/menaquinone biosynthesis C-methylase UbiE
LIPENAVYMPDRKEHWEHIYSTKKPEEVSWYEPTPATSLEFLRLFNLPKDAKIIDVGGGDSLFVDNLLDLGFTDVSVLDISASALERAKKRLGDRASRVRWIVSDAAKFEPAEQYDFWHDRAAFHFLTDEADVKKYIATIARYIKPDGIFVIGTFSEQGPKKCSGIEIKQYSEAALLNILGQYFEKVECKEIEHTTPFNTIQKFIFCSFKHK